MTKKQREYSEARAIGQYGLNKRDYFAALAMQGMIANPTYLHPTILAERSVEYADAVIKRLVETEPFPIYDED